MGNRPAFHCGAESCCEGAQYPECQQVQTSDGRNYTIRVDEPTDLDSCVGECYPGCSDPIDGFGPADDVFEVLNGIPGINATRFVYDPDTEYTHHHFQD